MIDTKSLHSSTLRIDLIKEECVCVCVCVYAYIPVNILMSVHCTCGVHVGIFLCMCVCVCVHQIECTNLVVSEKLSFPFITSNTTSDLNLNRLPACSNDLEDKHHVTLCNITSSRSPCRCARTGL